MQLWRPVFSPCSIIKKRTLHPSREWRVMRMLLLAFAARAASWHLSGAIYPARTPRAHLAAQLRPDSPRGLSAEIEAFTRADMYGARAHTGLLRAVRT